MSLEKLQSERSIAFSWFKLNSIVISEVLKVAQTLALYGNTLPRALSESFLCKTMGSFVMPNGFQIKEHGLVMNSPDGGDLITNHVYAETPNDTVMCWTFGQFILPDFSHLQPFDRIQIVMQELPESVYAIKELGIALLVENRQTIQEKLGLIYY